MNDPTIRMMLIEDIGEAFSNNSTPFADDIILVARQWGFRLRDIHVPVDVWHGEQDVFAPMQMGCDIVDAVFGSRVHLFPDDGYAIIFTHWQTILSTLVAI
jgi:pimeloyl-ACP methyl ester carboxylesterase